MCSLSTTSKLKSLIDEGEIAKLVENSPETYEFRRLDYTNGNSNNLICYGSGGWVVARTIRSRYVWLRTQRVKYDEVYGYGVFNSTSNNLDDIWWFHSYYPTLEEATKAVIDLNCKSSPYNVGRPDLLASGCHSGTITHPTDPYRDITINIDISPGDLIYQGRVSAGWVMAAAYGDVIAPALDHRSMYVDCPISRACGWGIIDWDEDGTRVLVGWYPSAEECKEVAENMA